MGALDLAHVVGEITRTLIIIGIAGGLAQIAARTWFIWVGIGLRRSATAGAVPTAGST